MTTRLIDQAELAVRIAEACMCTERPKGMDANSAMRQIMAKDAEAGKAFLRAAVAACGYLSECEQVDLQALPSNSFLVRV